jgi:hypothetical protein
MGWDSGDSNKRVGEIRKSCLSGWKMGHQRLSQVRSGALGLVWRVLPSLQDEEGKMLSDEDIRAEANTFMLEGESPTVGQLRCQGLSIPAMSWVRYWIIPFSACFLFCHPAW